MSEKLMVILYALIIYGFCLISIISLRAADKAHVTTYEDPETVIPLMTYGGLYRALKADGCDMGPELLKYLNELSERGIHENSSTP